MLGGVGLVGDADLIQNVRQSEGLMLQLELAAFQLAHIQDFVYQLQQQI